MYVCMYVCMCIYIYIYIHIYIYIYTHTYPCRHPRALEPEVHLACEGDVPFCLRPAHVIIQCMIICNDITY